MKNTVKFETYELSIDNVEDGDWVASPDGNGELILGTVYNVELCSFFNSSTGEKITEKVFDINFMDSDCSFRGQEDIDEYQIVGVLLA